MGRGYALCQFKVLTASATLFLGLGIFSPSMERASGQTLTNLDKTPYEMVISEGSSAREFVIKPEQTRKLDCKKSCSINFKNAVDAEAEGIEVDLLDTVVIESGRLSLEDEETENDLDIDANDDQGDDQAD